MTSALICGVSGQDGGYLARLLLDKGYTVWGSSRDAQAAAFSNLDALRIRDRVQIVSMAPSDFRSVLATIRRIEPAEIYFLAGQSSVSLSFEQPVETLESIVSGTLNVLEAIRLLDLNTRLYHASSSECFGDLDQVPANESTPFHPRSPYAVAKASAHWLVANYREAYGLHASNGVLFNHESPLRPSRFVTQKIVRAVQRIAAGSTETLELGRIDIYRDWGWAEEYVEAMWAMLQQARPDDYLIATGEAMSLETFVAHAFALKGLDWRRHVHLRDSLHRPADIAWNCGDAGKAQRLLGWSARTRGLSVVQRMLETAVPAS